MFTKPAEQVKNFITDVVLRLQNDDFVFLDPSEVSIVVEEYSGDDEAKWLVTITVPDSKDGSYTWGVGAEKTFTVRADKHGVMIVPNEPDDVESKPSEDSNVSVPPTDFSDIDTDEGTDIGAGVTVKVPESDLDKFEEDDYNISADIAFDSTQAEPDAKVDVDFIPELDKLSKAVKKEICKIKQSEFHVVNINLAMGNYVAGTAPVAINITVNVSFKPNVYHVNGDKVEKLKSSARQRTDGTWDVSFSTKHFSPFIFTTAELKNAVAAPEDSRSTTSGTTSTTPGNNPGTGIALAIAPVVLAAGAVAVVASKKKRG